MTKYAASPLPLLCVLLLALALRVWGLTWGLPSATHYFSYHPDESVVLEKSSLVMNVFAGRLLPHYYNYGSLQLYLICFANTLAALFGGVDIVPKDFAVWYPQWAKMYLIGRCLTVGMGVGTVWATYALGARVWGVRAGLFAALILAVIPLHVQHSHFLTVDVPATFWVMLSLFWSVRLAGSDPKPLKAALLAGFFAGLATATKYNMALTLLPLLIACLRLPTPAQHWLPGGHAPAPPATGRAEEERRRPNPNFFALPVAGGAGACAGVGAFLTACPGALLESGRFLRDFRFEAAHVQNENDPTFRDTGNGFVYQITHNLDAGLGLPLLVLALASVGYAAYRRQRGDALLAAFALPYFVLISLAAVRYARYIIPLLPILALWVGRMLSEGTRIGQNTEKRAVVAVAAFVFLATLANGTLLASRMAGEDTRDQALAELNRAVPPAQRIGFAVQPWFGTAPVSPYFPLPGVGAWQAATPPEVLKRIIYSGKDWDINALKVQKPDVVVLSEYDYDDALRLKDPAALAYIAELRRECWAFIEFPSLHSHVPSHLAPLPSSGLPHDMTYPSPQIIICVRGTKGTLY